MSADDLDLDAIEKAMRSNMEVALLDTPVGLALVAAARERHALRAEVERLRAMEALRMAADAAMCAEIEGAPDD